MHLQRVCFLAVLVKVEAGTAKVETPTPVATPVRSLAEGSAPQVPEPPRSLKDAVPETPPTPEGGRKPMTDRKVQC